MIKHNFFSVYFINQKGLFVLDVYAPNEKKAFDFIRTLTLSEFNSYTKYFENSSSFILNEAKMKERKGYSFNTSLRAGKQGFLAGWKSFIIKSRRNSNNCYKNSWNCSRIFNNSRSTRRFTWNYFKPKTNHLKNRSWSNFYWRNRRKRTWNYYSTQY